MTKDDKPYICTECGKDAKTCDHRYDMVGYDSDGSNPRVIGRNMKSVWSHGFSIDPKHLEKP